MSDSYDAVILGSGHNSLVLQAYLSQRGLSTICLERAEEAGGGLSTIEYPTGSGFWHNTHSFYHRGLTQMPWYRDLDLASHGAEYLTPDLNVSLLTRDGRSLQWWTSFDKTVESVAQFDARDAETIADWRRRFTSIVREILAPEAQSPPLPPEQRERKLRQTAEGRLLLETSRLSPIEFVQRELRHPTVQAGMLFFNGLREVDLRSPGFGHHIPALLASDTLAQMCRGGSRQLAAALCSVIASHGGVIRTGVRPTGIDVDAGQVKAVRTDQGEVIDCRLVISGLNPQQTFLELLSNVTPASWAEKARRFQYNLLAPLFAVNANLSDRPRYAAAADDESLDQAFMVILGLEHSDQFADIVAAHEAGKIPQTVMWGSCPTQFDATQAPPGKHTAFMWEKLPYRLDGDPSNWDREAKRHGQQMLDVWTEYAPNLADSVEEWFVRHPLDVERTLWNMQDGDLLIGSLGGGQVGYHRPFAGAGHYRTCFDGLYLCGGSCHPSGNITGLPGFNCAQVVLADEAQR